MESTEIIDDSRFDGDEASDAATFDTVDLQKAEDEARVEVLSEAIGSDGGGQRLSFEEVDGP